MSVKLRISDPVVISRGPRYKDVGWGTYQEPAIGLGSDGTVYASVKLTEDSGKFYGTKNGHAFFASKDGGESWEDLPIEEWESAAMKRALRLPNGERIRIDLMPLCSASPEELPTPVKIFSPSSGRFSLFYRADEIPDTLMEKGWFVDRYCEQTGEIQRVLAAVEHPNLSIGGGMDGEFVTLRRPFPHGRMRLAPDGSVWQTHYERGLHPITGAPSPFFNEFYYKSTDGGHSFALQSMIPYIPDISEAENAFDREGFDEGDIAFMPDGSMITLLRTGYSLDMKCPLYIARSLDGGKSWSKPQIFDKLGVWPCLCSLSCGVTLASYGRPGFFLRATDARDGQVWDDPVMLISTEVKPDVHEIPICPGETRAVFEWRSTCSYSDMVALDARTALLVYTDFYVPDENGENRKTLLCRKITVEE